MVTADPADVTATTDFTKPIDISANSIGNLPISVEAENITGGIGVDIQSNSITGGVPIDIQTQSVNQVAVDLAAQSLGTLGIDIEAQSIGDVDILFDGQNEGVASSSEFAVDRGDVTFPSGDAILLGSTTRDTAFSYTNNSGSTDVLEGLAIGNQEAWFPENEVIISVDTDGDGTADEGLAYQFGFGQIEFDPGFPIFANGGAIRVDIRRNNSTGTSYNVTGIIRTSS